MCGIDYNNKTYMDYRKITNKSTKQYYYRTKASTNEVGVREYNGTPLIAVGSPYGEVGGTLVIKLSSGKIFTAIIGDTKGDRCRHDDGSMLEFIVDTDILSKDIIRKGNLEELYGGHITNVWKQY